jgi:hypothetical protein
MQHRRFKQTQSLELRAEAKIASTWRAGFGKESSGTGDLDNSVLMSLTRYKSA